MPTKSATAKRYNQRLNMHLDDGMMESIKTEAAKIGLNVPSFVRMILKSELAKRKPTKTIKG